VEYALALLVLAALVAAVLWLPLRRRGEEERREETMLAELSAAKEAKYREIRDAELDHRMGKLSREDWRSVDRDLRAEAIEILRPRAGWTARGGDAGGRFASLAILMEAILSGLQIILAVVVIVLILLHSGKDAGLSGAFGVGTGAGPFGGGSLVERNLNRWTIFFALLFVANVIVLLKI
jgi:preprotein translocase subunit SecG